jgi:hypothetical protein
MGLGHARATSYLRTVAYISHPQPFQLFEGSATTTNCRSDVICHGALRANIVCKTWTLLKIKFTPEQAMKIQRGSGAIALPFLEPLSQMWFGWSTPRPGRFTPGKQTRYPLNRRLGGPQGRSGRGSKISPSTRIRSPDRSARSESLNRPPPQTR